VAATNKLTNASDDRPTQPKHKKPSDSHTLHGKQHVKPYAQGQLDCLCGLYSIINAITLIVQPIEPISYGKSRKLFNIGIEFLRQHDCLDPALVNGISIRRWKQLASLLAKHASTNTLKLKIELPSPVGTKLSTKAIMGWIEASVAAGSPVLLHLGRRYQHYTVIAAINQHNIGLFDSWQLQRIKRNGCVRRHDMTASSMMRLTVQLRI
jgi:hypothetical protein